MNILLNKQFQAIAAKARLSLIRDVVHRRKRMRNIIFLLILGLAVSGCFVQSINSFYTEDARVDLPELTGEWISEIQMGDSVVDKGIRPWVFTTNTVNTYDPQDTYSQLSVAYFNVDGTYFMDSTAGQLPHGGVSCANLYWFSGVIPVHTVCKVEIEANNLTLTPLNYEWFTNRVNEGTLDFPYVSPNDEDHYLFTATPENWITFLKEYKNDSEVFDPGLRFVFKREE